MNLGAPEIALIVVAVLLLFGYKKLPDASRSLGRSMRIFKGEMKGMKNDDVRGKDEAATVCGSLTPPAAATPDFEIEARAAEDRAALARARADAAWAGSARTDSVR